MYIKQSELLWGLDNHFIKEFIDSAMKKTYPEGYKLFSAGDPADFFYILMRGSIRLSIGEEDVTTYIVEHGGEAFGWSPDLLEPTPFENYMIPGIVLFVFLGLINLVVAIMIMLQKKYYAWFVLFQGVVLVIWLTVELIMNPAFYVAGLHLPFYTIGVLLILFGFFLKGK